MDERRKERYVTDLAAVKIIKGPAKPKAGAKSLRKKYRKPKGEKPGG